VSFVVAAKPPKLRRGSAPLWVIGLQAVLYLAFGALLFVTQGVLMFVPALISLILAQPFVVIVHEFGHAACGALVGMRPQAIRIFGGRPMFTLKGEHVTVVAGWKIFSGGRTAATPALQSSRRSRGAFMVAGGPISGFLIGAIGTGVASSSHGLVRALASGAALSGVFLSVINLLPYEAKSVGGGRQATDGLALLRLARPLRQAANHDQLVDWAVELHHAFENKDGAAVRRILAAHENDPTALLVAIEFAPRVGSVPQAKEIAARLLATAGEGAPPTLRATYHNQFAWVCLLAGDEGSLIDASHHADEALRLGSDASFCDTKAWVALLRGQYAEAHESFTTAYRGVGPHGNEARAVVAAGLSFSSEGLGDHRLAKAWRTHANSDALKPAFRIPRVPPIPLASTCTHTRTELDRGAIARAATGPMPLVVLGLIGSAMAYLGLNIGDHIFPVVGAAIAVAGFATALRSYAARWRA
jgi:hypothetical protein